MSETTPHSWESSHKDIPPPRSPDLLKRLLTEMRTVAQRSLNFLREFKRDPGEAQALKCLHTFSALLAFMRDGLTHPSDVDYVVEDDSFFPVLTILVDGIRKYKLIDFLEDSLQKMDETNPQRDDRLALLENVRGQLLQADIYLASRLKQTNEQKRS